MREPDTSFNRGAVKPLLCLRDGWRLIKEDYWLFLGITFVGVFLGSMGPFGVLIGPFLCGIHLSLLHQESGRRVSFNLLFKGFDYFLHSLVATLMMVVPTVLIVLVFYALFVLALFGTIAGIQQQGGPPPAGAFAFMIALWIALIVALIGLSIALQALFMFVYPLIVDRQMTGLQAVRTSFRAVFANLVGVVGLALLITLLSIAGVLACYVGAIFVLPIHYAMIAVAYRQVFPELDRFADFPPDEPDPDHEPASASLPGDTGIRTEEVADQLGRVGPGRGAEKAIRTK